VNNSANIHIEAEKDGSAVEDPEAWYRRLKADARVTAFSPQVDAPVVFSRGASSAPGRLVGCDPRRQAEVTTIAGYVVEGSFAGLEAGPRRMAIGVELQKSLGAALNDSVRVSPAGGVPTTFMVAAIFKTGIQQNDTLAYAALGDVQKANGTPGRVSEIAVKLADYTLASAIAKSLSGPGPDKVESWDQKNSNFVETFKAEDMVRFLSIAAVLLVSAFGIYNVLNMTVMQKRKDIAILRSMGYSFGDILTLFFSQGLILGFSGTLLGGLAGWCLCLYLRTVSFGGNPLGAGTGHLAVSLDPAIFLQAGVLALLATSLSSILPAYSAAKLSPIEIIRAGAE